MKTINITEEWRVAYDGTQYSLERWDEGGKEVRNPGTGEMVLQQPKWAAQGRYYPSIDGAVKRVIKVEASERANDLGEFLRYQAEWTKKIEEMLK